MNNYHIRDGIIKECDLEKDECPLVHYANIEEAETALDLIGSELPSMNQEEIEEGKNVTSKMSFSRKKKAIEKGEFTKELRVDEDETIRVKLAKAGYELPFLVNDISFFVRAAVAEQGHASEILAYDDNREVRRMVAKSGNCLDLLKNDQWWDIRLEVAKHGYELESFINDRNDKVRLEVAKAGINAKDYYYNDDSPEVRREAGKHI